ncbi:dimethyladenosine transferase [Cyclospora cayetanensis]|uniref:rRNA adenine N(6)-methyltransferase n=1 Tax=Cyclospora cayetanensis TaxID=88456 RepID=A0A1D3CU81_9EIME|nr:dimethyladenosine transferase [Cyclospora cayetanensis]
MALRAVRNRQARAAAVSPYAHPAAAPTVIRPLCSSSNASSAVSSARGGTKCADTATFPLQKKFGQHLLKNPGILDKLLAAANITSSDVVLEIGPGGCCLDRIMLSFLSVSSFLFVGTGNLTVRLLPLARRVIAMDIDSRMVAEVQRRCQSLGFSNLEIVHGDALRQDLGSFDVCAANLPYQISSPFLFKLLAHKHAFRCAVLMFQEEFGERLLAQPGEPRYCRLAANVHLFAKVTRVCKVDRNSFRPPPKVDSVIVKITPRKEILPVDFREWNGLLRICFTRKRKTLRSIFKKPSVLSMLEQNHKVVSAFKGAAPVNGSQFRDLCFEAIQEAGVSDRRSVSISTAEFYKLLLEFHRRSIFFQNAADLELNKEDTKEGISAGVEELFWGEGEAEMSEDSEDEHSEHLNKRAGTTGKRKERKV